VIKDPPQSRRRARSAAVGSSIVDLGTSLASVLDAYAPETAEENRDVARIRELVASGDPWSRTSALHVTGSALILHPGSGRVLLRWHERQQGWLQVGGHADAGETRPFSIALREAREETGLPDLESWPDSMHPVVVQIVIVPVPAAPGEPEHEHADLRYLLSTDDPDAATPESEQARLRWLSIEDARAAVPEDNIRVCLDRITRIHAGA
jgi:8-oxo-dGTP pyrophosphatase MutT (NUDIX family)